MKVLSLFDGMSCGMIALDRAGINVSEYYASEIDKYAIKVSDANYPDIVRLGDVQTINYQMLPKIDLLIGGSPCQGFSLAGKGLNFSDPRSALFFEFVHALRETKPKYFMLENVSMKKEFQKAISKLLRCKPIKINSALVSAQNRARLYWTNIPNIIQPKDKKIMLSGILQNIGSCNLGLKVRDKSKCIRVGGRGSPLKSKQEWDYPYIKTDKHLKIKTNQGKASCLTGGGHSGGNHSDMDIIVIQKPRGNNKGGPRALNGKTPTLSSSGWVHNNHIKDGEIIRRFSVTECERLQTVPDGYTQNKEVSNSQCYKMLGNGWTVDVITHIFKGIA